MKQKQGRVAEYLRNSINDYYQYNPDTLMPLLMLALATQGKLSLGTGSDCGTTFASIDIDEVAAYEWVKLNPALKKRLKEAKSEGASAISVVGDIPAELADIYETFHHYDTVTVVQEYHHRKGILVQHSSNSASEKAQRQYATILFAEELLCASQEWLQDCFLSIANNLLVHSGIQPGRPRIRVAQALCTLLDYDGEGVVYNPFAGCAIAAAMVGAGENLVADGDKNDKLLASARLLCYGTGQRGFDIAQRDSLEWIQGRKADYVMSTFLGYPGGKSAFDICLSHCLENFSCSGKFAGIAAPRDIFEKRSEEMKEALNRDWVDTIVLLPFGEVAVLIDAAKPAVMKNKVRFFNLTHPMLSRRPLGVVLEDDDFAKILKLSDVKKKGYLKSLVTPEIEVQDGCEIISLGDIYEKMPRQTWSLAKVPEDEQVLATIDRTQKYDEWKRARMQGIEKESIVSLFSPAYKLDQDCLIVNSKGNLEPRLFDSDFGYAFFQDGFAFKRKDFFEELDFDWLIHELNKPYVERQLHPYGFDEMVPESFTEDQVLAVKLNRPLPEDEDDCDNSSDYLEPGHILHGSNKTEYIIHQWLGNGNFGYAYSAASRSLVTGEEREVVLKEFYPNHNYHRENGKVVPNSLEDEMSLQDDKMKFKTESELMMLLGNLPDSHIVPSIDFFYSPETDTEYYVMPYFKAKSFDDFLNNGNSLSEVLAIHHVVIPLCKALHTSQKKKVLHLDIKPENVLIDDNGDAVLTDYGTAKVYDENDVITFRGGMTSSSRYAAPELKGGSLTRYDPRPDLFGIAGTIYTLITRKYPITLFELDSDGEERTREALRTCGCCEQFSDAVVAGLQASMALRPKNAQEFLNLFPGCEDIKLK